jgi:hypothetical protein
MRRHILSVESLMLQSLLIASVLPVHIDVLQIQAAFLILLTTEIRV